MTPLRSLRSWWHARKRRRDVAELWPEICREARSYDGAEAIVLNHYWTSPHWQGTSPHEALDALREAWVIVMSIRSGGPGTIDLRRKT